MKSICKKLNYLLVASFFIMIIFAVPSFAGWGKTEKGGIYWANEDNTYMKDGWKLIDDDNDGVGYYYYFNENGFILLDDITPDYKIVNKEGKQLDSDGKVVSVKIEKLKLDDGTYDNAVFSEEILAQIKEQGNIETENKGFISTGLTIYAKASDSDMGPGPGDSIVVEANADGTARWLLGPNVVLKEKNTEKYDASLSREMTEYIKSSDKFSKSVNGTTFTKSKWKGVMALKGTGATVIFENPNHNFNKLKGRIATHYFTYEDRTTQCVLRIIDEDTGEELYSTSAFNYNGGCSFECTFYQRTSAIRFELEVTGQYTSRVCYLRQCQFAFDRDIWEEEQYEMEVEAAYIEKYGTESEADYVEEEEGNDDDSMGEISIEGEDPGARYRRINNIEVSTISELERWANMDYDEEDDSITPEMKASISEARRKLSELEEKASKVSGPAFDKSLKDLKPAVGPNGYSNIIEGHEGDG